LKTKPRILICDPIEENGIAKLRQADFEVDNKPTITPEELKETISNYDAIIVRSRTKVTKDIINAGNKLKIIGRAGAGLDNVDVQAAEKKGIKVLNTPEAPSLAVAELTVGLMLALARNIPLADKSMKEEKWLKKQLTGWELKDKTLGIIGLGNTGEKVARIAKAFGMKVLIHKRTPPSSKLLSELEAEFVPFDVLLQKSDIVTVHVPLTPQTLKMIGATELRKMKQGAVIINTSRGAIIDEKALLNALKSGKLGGAALDVFEYEPPKDWALAKLPNVVCTPHIGAQTEESQRAATILLVEKIIGSFLF